VDSYAIVVRRLPGATENQEADQAAGKPAKSSSLRSRVLRKLGRIALNMLFAVMMAAAGIMIVPAALGFHRYIILTGSMTGTYDRGSIVYDQAVPVSQLKVGDPITYDPPAGFTTGVYKRVTHRIIWIGRGANGERAFRTKGDANKSPDAWKFGLGHGTQDRVVFHIPELGYLFVLLSLRNFRMVLVGIPAVLMGLFMIRGLWRDAGVEARRKKLAEAGWQQVEDPGPQTVLPPVASPAEVRLPVRLVLSCVTVPRRPLGGLQPNSGSQPPALGAGARLVIVRLGQEPPAPDHSGAAPAPESRSPSDSAAALGLRVRALVLGAATF
jgi:signal peptidase